MAHGACLLINIHSPEVAHGAYVASLLALTHRLLGLVAPIFIPSFVLFSAYVLMSLMHIILIMLILNAHCCLQLYNLVCVMLVLVVNKPDMPAAIIVCWCVCI